MKNIVRVEKMFKLPDAGSLKAFADVVINEYVVIRGVRIMEGKKGLFVGLPKEQGKDNKWYDIVTCMSAQAYEDISNAVIEHYNKK